MGKEQDFGQKVKEGWEKKSLRRSCASLVRSYKLGQVSFCFYYVQMWLHRLRMPTYCILRHSGVCRKCRERLKEMIGTEMSDIPVSELGVDSTDIPDQMERLMLDMLVSTQILKTWSFATFL